MTDNNPAFVYDAINELMDDVAMIPDPVRRVAALQYALTLTRGRVTAARDAAAYDARVESSSAAVSRRTGYSADAIRQWVRSHSQRTGDTRKVRAPSADLAGALRIDLRH